MTDIDSNILKLTYSANSALDHDVLEHVAGQIQELQDKAVQEETAELQRELRDATALNIRMTEDLARETRARELITKSHIKQTSFLRTNDAYLMSVTKNPLLKFLARLAKWPEVPVLARTKYQGVNEALAEMHRQDVKWGAERQMPNGTGAEFNFSDELADYYRNETDSAFASGSGTWQHILTEEYYEAMAETNPRKLKVELIQLAAVAIQWWVSLVLQRPKR